MKKSLGFLTIILVGFLVFVPKADAITIQDYRKELADLKAEKEENEKNKEEIQAKIDQVNAEVAEITKDIATATENQEKTEDEIEKLEEDIQKKEQQIKDLVSFYQISNSENFYLKYLFGADSFTDFIYRFSVIEQLATTNDQLVEEMNDLVAQNEKKLEELEKTKKELAELNKQAQAKLSEYANQQTDYTATSMDLDTQIEIVEEKIRGYVEDGCGEYQDLSTCTTSIPFDYGFNRPLKSGYINDEFGMRYHPIDHVWKNHNGIDIGGNSEGTPVYAAAAGKVVDVMHYYSCGGNIVTINHIINGKSYTTRYWHLLRATVEEGEIVEKGEQVGEVGGGSTAYINGGYDRCTTGTHLHFEMAEGHYYGTGEDSYSSWSTYTGKVFDPRMMVYFPAYGVWW